MGKLLKNRYEIGLLIIIILIGAIVRFTYAPTALFEEGFWLILLALCNIFLFFLLAKRFFYALSITLFLTFIFSILPWQIQFSRFEEGKIIASILTSIFFLLIYWDKKQPSFKKTILIFGLFILPLLVLTTTKQQINNLPFPPNKQEVEEIKIYRGLLNPINSVFSRLYSNKVSVTLKNMEINFFESADLNNYFFANHPLERVGVKETEKFYSGLLPLFVVGLLYANFLADGPTIIWLCALFLLNSFLSNRYFGINSLFVIPFLLVIGRGLQKILEVRTAWKKNIALLSIFTWLTLEIIVLSLHRNLFF